MPVGQARKAAGRGLTFAFAKGGQETSQIMNLINLPMDSSAVVKKMMKGLTADQQSTAGPSPGPGAANSETTAATSKEAALLLKVKQGLAEIKSLNISLKESEMKKLQLKPCDATKGVADGDDEGKPSSSEMNANAKEEVKTCDGDGPTGGGVAQDGPEAKRRKFSKVERKRAAFKGYEAEKETFSVMATSSTGDCRPITALDDLLAALNFVLRKLLDEKVITDEHDPSIMGAFGFVAGLWFEFAFQGRVCLNGRDFRQYSALRTELQQTLIDATEKIQISAPDAQEGSAQANHSGSGKRRGLSPLELAELLSRDHLDTPVTKLVWDDEDPDERAIKSICTVMTTMQEAVVKPLKNFVAQTLPLPLLMHEAVLLGIKQILSVLNSKELDLNDMTSMINSILDEKLPASWQNFVFNVASTYGDKGHFIERTDEAVRANQWVGC